MIRLSMRWGSIAAIVVATACSGGSGARPASSGPRLAPANAAARPATPGTVAPATDATSQSEAGRSQRPDNRAAAQVAGDGAGLRISATTLPARPLIEKRPHSQRL